MEYRRYARIIQGLLSPTPFVAEAESEQAVQVERGLALPMAMLKHNPPADMTDRLAEPATQANLGQIAVVDRRGHQRPMYRGLLTYAWAQSLRVRHQGEPRLSAWCAIMDQRLEQCDWGDGPVEAARGASAAEACWSALALHAAQSALGHKSERPGELFRRLAQAQQPSGAFLLARSSDNPETHWYHELVILHAAASYAVESGNAPVKAAVLRNAEFHQNETQPDHASTQPWGLFAFIWNPATQLLADQLLHAAQTQMDGVSRILLADTLYCLGKVE